MPDLPLVSIVTPVYQMAGFIGETLQSVLDQDYPRIEHIVMDAGSTDGTLDVIREYAAIQRENVTFRWYSEPDSGAADAINKGFARSTGAIFAYLNADDTYLPGAISAAVRALTDDPDIDGVYGEANWVREDGAVLRPYPTRAFDAQALRSECFICQPASFLRREAFADCGMLDASLSYSFDYDLWIRLTKHHRLRKIDHLMATSRMHANNKTLGGRRQGLRETIEVLRRNYGYAAFGPVLAYTAHLMDGGDQFSSEFRASMAAYLAALPVGWRLNWKHPLRYAGEWSRAMIFDAIGRHVPRP